MSDIEDDETDDTVIYVLDKAGTASSIDPRLPPEERLKIINRQNQSRQKARRGVAPPVTEAEVIAAFNLTPATYHKFSAEYKLKLINEVSSSKAKA